MLLSSQIKQWLLIPGMVWSHISLVLLLIFHYETAVNLSRYIKQLLICWLPFFWCIWKILEWYFFAYIKALWLDVSFYANFLQAFHTAFLWQMLSGTISSQQCMTWQRPWKKLLPCKRNKHANPRGSYT